MCGIAGIVSYDGNDVREARLERMAAVLRHRGPDDAGLWCSPGTAPAAGFAHRRLTIIDLSTAGHQPMTSGCATITFNGEVYNHPKLYTELTALGYSYRGHCDTETVLLGYREWGWRVVDRLRGMFAFGVWDESKRELVLARDRLGIKPLYYAHVRPGVLVFASEIKAILESGLVEPAASRSALHEYLLFGYLSGPTTMFGGVRVLPPGHVLICNERGVRLKQYWDVIVSSDSLAGDEELFTEFDHLLDSAVKSHLLSDVPVGAFLSGGLDSSLVVALMRTRSRRQVKTFAVGFPRGEYSELPYARTVARHVGSEHFEVIVTPQQFIEALPAAVWHEDEPLWTSTSIALYYVARLASQHVRVVLSGEGSDELFAGYDRYWCGALNERLRLPYARVPGRVRAAVKRGLDHSLVPERARRALSHTLFSREDNVKALVFDNWFGVFTPSMQRDLLSEAVTSSTDAQAAYGSHLVAYCAGRSESVSDRMQTSDIKTNLVELLMKQDRMSMAFSLEARVPYLDHPLVEFAARVPRRLKLGRTSGKLLLKRAAKAFLPPEIIARRKRGFPVPFDDWLRRRYPAEVRGLLLSDRALSRGWFKPDWLVPAVENHLTGRHDRSRQVWGLVTLELWARIFLDGDCGWRESPGDWWARQRAGTDN
jgi:asparagine synthase (glutamine-hydrolysing)